MPRWPLCHVLRALSLHILTLLHAGCSQNLECGVRKCCQVCDHRRIVSGHVLNPCRFLRQQGRAGEAPTSAAEHPSRFTAVKSDLRHSVSSKFHTLMGKNH